MSWSDDTRCLFCDGKLPLYRKITSGQFCSAAHGRAYWKEQERLAVERLSQTHDSLRAYRQADADAILGPPITSNPAAPLGVNPYYLDRQSPREDAVLDFARTTSNRDEVHLAGFVRSVPPLASDWSTLPAMFAAGPVSFTASAPEILATSGSTPIFEPVVPFEPPFAETIELASAMAPAAMERDRPDFVQAIEPSSPPVSRSIDLQIAPESPVLLLTPPVAIPAGPAAAQPVAVSEEPAFAAAPLVVATPAFAAKPVAEQPLIVAEQPAAVSPIVETAPVVVEEPPAPIMADAVALPKMEARPFEFLLSKTAAAPLENSPSTPAIVPLQVAAASRNLDSAQMLALVAPRTSASASGPVGSIQALDARFGQTIDGIAPLSGLATPAAAAQIALASAVRYPLRSGDSVPRRTAIAPAETVPGTASFRELSVEPARFLHEPVAPGLVKLPVKFTPVALEVAEAFTANLAPAFPEGAGPRLPKHPFEPVDGSAVPPPPRSFLAFANWTPGDPSERGNAWEHVSDFWAHAPRDLKLLLFAIPVLLGLALHPRLPKVHMTAPSGSAGIEKNVQQAFAQQLNVVERNVASRAGVALAEDFRSGLEDWQTHGDLSAAWSYDANGFVRPGSLALYRPSMHLSDYELQFLGLIDKKALSFVARAQDFENYYVIKLVVLKSGPLPTIGVTRYAVINGKAQNRVDSIAPINAMPDMLYHVDLNVHDDTYLLTLQGKVVDTWSEPRLTRGGVGFFAPRGEESRVRWVQLTHQYDMLGRLCAYLAPYNTPTTNGSW